VRTRCRYAHRASTSDARSRTNNRAAAMSVSS
jgi:hypothetical protein